MKKKCLASFFLFVAGILLHASDGMMLFDFRSQQLHGWRGNSYIQSLTPTPEGLHVVTTGGEDPWIEGPAMPELPPGDYDKVNVEVHFRNASSTNIEIFWGERFIASKSCRIAAQANGQWHTSSAVFPRFAPGDRLRLDPEGMHDTLTIAWIKVTPLRNVFSLPASVPQPCQTTASPVVLNAGKLTLKHHPAKWDAFIVEYAGQPLASSHDQPQLAIRHDGKTELLNLAEARTTTTLEAGTLRTRAKLTDAAGTVWTLERTFTPRPDQAVAVTTTFVPHADSQLVNLPFLTLFPGLGSYGQRKQQALLAGAEYLVKDEVSSSELDVRGDNANRLSVDPIKLTFPLMALSVDGRWLSLSWDSSVRPATLFDVPDRQFHSGANLWALWLPGISESRFEGSLNVYRPLQVKANVPLTLHAVIAAGEGQTVVPAVQAAVARMETLPPPPAHALDFQDVLRLLAAGYLDSAANINHMWRHAVHDVPGSFPAMPAVDPIVFMAWLAQSTSDPQLAKRLRQEIELAMPFVLEKDTFRHVGHSVSAIHVNLFFNRVEFWLDQLVNSAHSIFRQTREDGSIPYVKPKNSKHDYASTHWTDHANGFTSARGQNAAFAALASNAPQLRDRYLQWTRKLLELYGNDVPRGGQTWEIPLHTPDILGAGSMLEHAMTAYQLSGDASFLEHASYWAWTGVPFVYLDHPAQPYGPTGLYGTIAVLGGTSWRNPFWIGLPVQWCGLVYRNSLIRYADLLAQLPAHRAQADFWRGLANGITLAGTCMLFPLTDKERQGLLPDFFVLKPQRSAGPAINPGTILSCLPEAYGQRSIFGQTQLKTGTFVFALGDVTPLSETSVALDLWPSQDTQVLISGLPGRPETIQWNGKDIAGTWNEKHRALVLTLRGKGTLSFK